MESEIAIIGSGPGGSVTAATLADAGREVLLIENGSNCKLDSCVPFSIEEMEQKYRNGGLTPTFGKPKIPYVEGSCVGGGSEVNSGLYHRIPEEVIKKWENEFKVEGIKNSDLEPHYKAIEHNISVSYLPYGAPKASLKLQEGALNLGWKFMEVPKWFKYDNDGVGIKQSMTETYIPRFERNGGRVLSNTRAKKIIKSGSKWMIICENAVSSEQIKIKAENLFVCGGAIHTPALLRRSGIRKNIGNTLQMHPKVKVIAKFPEKVNFKDMGVPALQVKEFAPDFSFGCSISSKHYLALGMLDHPECMSEVDDNWEYMAVYYAMIIPKGSGTIRNVPFFKDPFVSYDLKDDDMRILAEALKKLCLLLFEAGAEYLYPSISGFNRIRTKKEIERIPELLTRQNTNLMTIHLFSSCPMGEVKRTCATDSFGKVSGYDNLYINDGSLLCSAPGVNPQGAIMAIARRNAFHFLDNGI